MKRKKMAHAHKEVVSFWFLLCAFNAEKKNK
jgi:hypothetical protein